MFNFFNKEVRYAVRSPKWSTVRKNHLKEQPRCQACDRNKDLEVHHIIPVHVDPDMELETSNLLTLCSKCHLCFGHLYDYKSWNPSVVEDTDKFFKKVKHRPYDLN